jgi:hypothetical protein
MHPCNVQMPGRRTWRGFPLFVQGKTMAALEQVAVFTQARQKVLAENIASVNLERLLETSQTSCPKGSGVANANHCLDVVPLEQDHGKV